MKKFLIIILLLIPVPLLSADDLIRKTAEHICDLSSQKNKSRIAVYTFTDSEEKETADSEKCTTEIISCVLSCKNIKVIDPTKIKQVMTEQEKGLIGIVDDETAPETGKLLGADALIFGQVDGKTIQIRLIDAETGEILGASVQESGKSKEAFVKEQNFNSKESKDEFRRSQLRKQLDFLFKTKPGIFLFMTSTDSELDQYKSKNPQGYDKTKNLLQNSPKDKKEKFNRSRETVLSLRESDEKFNTRIVNGHKKILSKESGRIDRNKRPPRRK